MLSELSELSELPDFDKLFPGLYDSSGVGQSGVSLLLNSLYRDKHILQPPTNRTDVYYDTNNVDPFAILGQPLPEKQKGGTSKKRVRKRQTSRQCPHGQRDDQCAICGGRNICSRHGSDKTRKKRKTRCRECWKEGEFPSELCRNHGNRIGFCRPCVEAGVMKPTKRAQRAKKAVKESDSDTVTE